MRVLVTGGSGWIGGAVCAALHERKHECIPFDRTSGQDVLVEEQVRYYVDQADHVIHLAGLLGTHELFGRAQEAVAVNVMGSLNVTVACADKGVGLTEITMPRVNPSLYAATKACAMDIALAYHAAGKLRCSFVRAYNAYGPGQAYGGDHPQKIIPTFASKAWAGEPLPIWGDGSLWTDLVHVDDVARVLVSAMHFGDGEVFDAGSGHPQMVREVAWDVIDMVRSLGGPVSSLEHLPPRLGERTRSSIATDVAQGEGWEHLLGWRPVFDRERLVEAVESYRP